MGSHPSPGVPFSKQPAAGPPGVSRPPGPAPQEQKPSAAPLSGSSPHNPLVLGAAAAPKQIPSAQGDSLDSYVDHIDWFVDSFFSFKGNRDIPSTEDVTRYMDSLRDPKNHTEEFKARLGRIFQSSASQSMDDKLRMVSGLILIGVAVPTKEELGKLDSLLHVSRQHIQNTPSAIFQYLAWKLFPERFPTTAQLSPDVWSKHGTEFHGLIIAFHDQHKVSHVNAIRSLSYFKFGCCPGSPVVTPIYWSQSRIPEPSYISGEVLARRLWLTSNIPFSSALGYFFDTLADCKLLCSDGTVECERSVLARFSIPFQDKFCSGERNIEVKDFSFSVVTRVYHQMLRHLTSCAEDLSKLNQIWSDSISSFTITLENAKIIKVDREIFAFCMHYNVLPLLHLYVAQMRVSIPVEEYFDLDELHGLKFRDTLIYNLFLHLLKPVGKVQSYKSKKIYEDVWPLAKQHSESRFNFVLSLTTSENFPILDDSHLVYLNMEEAGKISDAIQDPSAKLSFTSRYLTLNKSSQGDRKRKEAS